MSQELGEQVYQHLVSVPYAMGSQGDFIVANGNVGIGTTDPTAKLQIYDSSSPTIKVTDSDAGNTVILQADGSSGWVGTLGSNELRIGTGGQPRMTIDTGGNVGIGIQNPAAKLDVGGKIHTDNNLYVDGNIGIGTLTPSRKLHVSGDNAEIRLDAAGNGGNDRDFTFRVTGPTSSFDTLYIQGETYEGSEDFVPLVAIHANGNVGIGADPPEAKLDVRGDLIVSGEIMGSQIYVNDLRAALLTDSDDSRYSIDPTGVSVVNTICFSLDGNCSSFLQQEGNYLTAGGNFQVEGNTSLQGSINIEGIASLVGRFGIGTSSPENLLHVKGVGEGNRGGIRIEYEGGDGPWDINTGDNSSALDGKLGFDYGGESKMVLTQEGNVGIGVGYPQAKLEVAGDIQADGRIMGGCSSGQANNRWTSGNNHCYMQWGSPTLTFTEAHEFCQQLGGYLATITSQAEEDFLGGNLHVGTAGWIGYRRISGGNWSWVTGELGFKGSGYYENWGGNYSGAGGTQSCGTIQSDGVWNDQDCDSDRWGYICEKDF